MPGNQQSEASATPAPATATVAPSPTHTSVPTETGSLIAPGELEVGVLWSDSNSPEAAHYSWIAQSLEADIPGTKVIFTTNNAPQRSAIDARTLAGTPLDLDLLFDGRNPATYTWVENGYLLNLNPYMNVKSDSEETWKASIKNILLPSMTYNTKIYGIPDQVFVWAIYYNNAFFTEYEIEPPSSWEALTGACPVILQSSGGKVSPIAISGQFDLYAGMWFDQVAQRACGAEKVEVILSGTSESTLQEEACLQTAFETLSQLAASQCLSPDWEATGPAEAQNSFKLGEAAMIFMGSWMTTDLLASGMPIESVAVLPFPSIEGGEGNQEALFGRALVWNIPAESDHPELAVEFLKRLTAPAAAERAVQTMSIISSLEEAPIPDMPTGMDNIIKAMNSNVSELIPMHYNLQFDTQGLAQAWYDPAIQVLAGRLSPAQALQTLSQNLDAHFDSN